MTDKENEEMAEYVMWTIAIGVILSKKTVHGYDVDEAVKELRKKGFKIDRKVNNQ